MAAAEAAIPSLVKYDVPTLVEKGRKAGAESASETQDMLASLLPPR
jgi:hypothetical protein